MARTPYIPPELTKRPFSLQEARIAGLTHSALRSKAWRRLGHELYCSSGLRDDPWLVLSAWQRLLPTDGVFAGATAGWLLGLDLDPIDPVAIVVPPNSGIRPRTGLAARRCEVPAGDIVTVRGLRATTLNRTLFDLSIDQAPVEALVAIDMAVRRGLTNPLDLARHTDLLKGRAGAARLRTLAAIAAPAESAMETRLRWLLIQAGLPYPEVQTNLRDDDGRFVGRADLYYPAARLVIEYDGGVHRDQLVEDNRRQNLLLNAGFRLLRFTAADIYTRQDVVAAQVRGALGTALTSAPLTSDARNRKRRGARLTPDARNRWSGVQAWPTMREMTSPKFGPPLPNGTE